MATATKTVSAEATAVFNARLVKATKLANALRLRLRPSLTAEDVDFLLANPNRYSAAIRERVELLAGVNAASDDTWKLVRLLLEFAEEGQAVVEPVTLEGALSRLPSRRGR